MIECLDVTKTYAVGEQPFRALNSVSARIGKGEFIAIAGPSGSGKTTLMNLIGALDRPDSGSIKVAGVSYDGLSDNDLRFVRLDKIGYVFQNFNLIQVLSAYENVEYPLLLGREIPSAKARKEKVETLLDLVGLGKFGARFPNQLSGGQKQRVAIARALARDPDIIIADEPTANLDSVTGDQIVTLMRKARDDRGTTVVFSTHDHNVLSRVDRIIYLHDGGIAKEEIRK